MVYCFYIYALSYICEKYSWKDITVNAIKKTSINKKQQDQTDTTVKNVFRQTNALDSTLYKKRT